MPRFRPFRHFRNPPPQRRRLPRARFSIILFLFYLYFRAPRRLFLIGHRRPSPPPRRRDFRAVFFRKTLFRRRHIRPTPPRRFRHLCARFGGMLYAPPRFRACGENFRPFCIRHFRPFRPLRYRHFRARFGVRNNAIFAARAHIISIRRYCIMRGNIRRFRRVQRGDIIRPRNNFPTDIFRPVLANGGVKRIIRTAPCMRFVFNAPPPQCLIVCPIYALPDGKVALYIIPLVFVCISLL